MLFYTDLLSFPIFDYQEGRKYEFLLDKKYFINAEKKKLDTFFFLFPFDWKEELFYFDSLDQLSKTPVACLVLCSRFSIRIRFLLSGCPVPVISMFCGEFKIYDFSWMSCFELIVVVFAVNCVFWLEDLVFGICAINTFVSFFYYFSNHSWKELWVTLTYITTEITNLVKYRFKYVLIWLYTQ